MTRPKSKKTEKLTVWISPVLKDLIYKKAQSVGMNISDFVRYVLNREVDK